MIKDNFYIFDFDFLRPNFKLLSEDRLVMA